jgi:hypothetical protein
MDPDKLFGRQFKGEGFEVVQGEDGVGLAFEVDLRIVLHAFAEKDVLELDLDDLILRFDENERFIPGMMDIDRGGEIVLDLADGGEKALKGKRSVEIAEHIHVRLFLILFLLVCDADDDRVVAGLLQPEHDTVVQEPDIPENDVCPGKGHLLKYFSGSVAPSGKIQPGCFGDIFF